VPAVRRQAGGAGTSDVPVVLVDEQTLAGWGGQRRTGGGEVLPSGFGGPEPLAVEQRQLRRGGRVCHHRHLSPSGARLGGERDQLGWYLLPPVEVDQER